MSQAALLPQYRKPRWSSPGLTQGQERVFNWLAATLVVSMLSGWIITVVDLYGRPDEPLKQEQRGTLAAPGAARPLAPVSRTLSSSLLDPRSKGTAYINDAALEFLDPLRGYSGKLRAAFRTPGQALSPENADDRLQARYSGQSGSDVVSDDLVAPASPGVYKMAVQLDNARRAIEGLSLVTLVPFSEKKGGKIGLYYLGSWPYENGGKPRSRAYDNPDGFIEVTRENRDLYVSEHFRLGDFLTKDQGNVWPKYLLLDPRLLDKLELVVAELNRRGYNVKHVTVMSGFRTPRYNHGGGNTGGRANLSRHMYGDASDIFVDNDRDHWTDDINRDGRVDIKDAEIIASAVERVHQQYPSLVGGIGIYSACCGHGPFVHVDVRGYAARWRGSGNG